MPQISHPEGVGPGRSPLAGDGWFRGRLPQLDALRGVAILLVLLVHSPAGKFLPYAWCGVDLFFVLSGFLITGILVDTGRGECYFLNFYVRRALRIWPLYGLMLVMGLVVLPRLGGGFSVRDAGGLAPWYVLFLQNFATGAAPALLVTWSLAIEEQFYLVWPVLTFFLSRRGLGWVVGGLLIGSPILRYVLLKHGVPPVDIFRWSFTRGDGLAAGAAVALWVRRGEAAESVARAAWGVLLIVVPLTAWALRVGVRSVETTGHPALYSAAFSGLSIGFAAVLALALASEGWQRGLDFRGLRGLGAISYGLYLFHGPVYLVARTWGMDFFRVTLGWSRGPVQGLVWLVAVGAVVGLAALSYQWFERPFLGLKRHFVPRPQVPAPVPPSEPGPGRPDRPKRSAARATW